ncbi:hypothetical protein EVAR_45381_1 [Eumeta japonica]|uniref:Uncharacterized protein n=1 Tax=Eumeta variegata TaxID=151549 RepID=A0A4C1WQ39_EUMVA|nr:hypothetical protein EVAR_45381_1 [Eumeta japonica]
MSENSIDIALVQETYLKLNRPKACSIAGYVQLRTDRTYSSKGVPLCTTDAPYIGPINIPPLTNMEATGCRLAMTGHSTLVIVSVLLPTTSGQWSRRASGRFRHLGSPEVSARYSRIDKRTKTQLCAARAHIPPRVQIQSASLQREVKARVREFRNESWSDLMEEIKPSHKAFWVTKALKTEGYTPIPHSKPDNSVAIDDAEIAECLADSIETQCSRFLRTTSLISVASRKRFSKNFPRT